MSFSGIPLAFHSSSVLYFSLVFKLLIVVVTFAGYSIMEIKAAKVTTTISNLKTKEKYKTEEEWKAKGIPEKDIRRDVHVLMPKLDLFGKTK